MLTLLIVVGGLSQGSLNKKLAAIALDYVNNPTGVQESLDSPEDNDDHRGYSKHSKYSISYTATVFQGLDTIPFYNQDLDTGDAPESVIALRTAIGQADALLVITPEYNGTMPAVVKNAIDWASRPYGKSVLSGKPYGILGTSLGVNGGITALEHVHASLTVAGAVFVEEALIAIPASKFNGAEPAQFPEIVATVGKICDDLIGNVPVGETIVKY